MGTFYQYADRRVEDQIDWGKLGLDVSQSIRQERDQREQTKAKLDEELNKEIKAISDIPIGENNNLNTLAADAAEIAQNQLLMTDRLFKSGQIGMKERMTINSNVNDGIVGMFDMIKGWNESYSKKMSNANLSALDLYNMSQLEQFGNLQKAKPYLNPKDGTLSMVIKDENGKIVNHMTINKMKGLMNRDIPKYDVVGSVKAGVDRLVPKNVTIDVFEKDGSLTSARDSYIKSMLVSPIQVQSILSDYVKQTGDGKTFTFTNVKTDNPNEIYVKDGIPQLTPTQEEIAKNELTKLYNSMIDRPKPIEKKVVSPYEQDQYAKLAKGKKQEQDLITDLVNLYSGDATDFNISATRLAGLDPNKNITSISRTKDGIDITVKGTKGESTIPFSFNGADGKPLTQQQFIKKISTFLVSDFTNLDKVPEGTLNAEPGGFEVKKELPTADPFRNIVIPVIKEGKTTYVDAPDYFDSNYVSPSGWRLGMSENLGTAESVVNIAEKSFRQMPAELTSGIEIKAIGSDELNSDKAATMIYIPTVMDTPIYIPATGNGEYSKAILEYLYDATASGTPVDMNEVKRLFEPGLFDKYNKVSVQSKKVDASKY